MEIERAEMVAEVEAQIERALASMAVDLDESDYVSSRPQSRLSTASGTRSRKQSDAAMKTKVLRSFSTESTLAEQREEGDAAKEHSAEEVDLQSSSPAPRKKRFSASEVDLPQDGMNAVDEGISIKSDKIAQKVIEIQHKVRQPLLTWGTELMVFNSLNLRCHRNAVVAVVEKVSLRIVMTMSRRLLVPGR